MSQEKLNLYMDFVEKITSEESNNTLAYIERLKKLDAAGVNMALLDTAASGLSSEGGEVAEIVKKIKFHGKDMDEDVRFHLKRELGDVMWYWINACRALGLEPFDVIEENINKLEARYPGGTFSEWHSDNRKDGDI